MCPASPASPLQVRVEPGSLPPAPIASQMGDEQDMNDTLGQLLVVMNKLDDQIGELKVLFC